MSGQRPAPSSAGDPQQQQHRQMQHGAAAAPQRMPPAAAASSPPYGPQNPQHYTPAPRAAPPPPETRQQKVVNFFQKANPGNPIPPAPPARAKLADLLHSMGDDYIGIAEVLASQGAWADIASLPKQKADFYPDTEKALSLLVDQDLPENVAAMKDLARRVHIHALAKLKTGKPDEALRVLQQGDVFGVFAFGHDGGGGQSANAYLCLAPKALSCAPFSMRLLRCALEEGPHALYQLLALVERRIAELSCDAPAEGAEGVDLWERRRRAVLVKLTSKLGAAGDVAPVLKILTDLCGEERHSRDVQLQHRRAAAMMQAGHIGEVESIIGTLQAQLQEEGVPEARRQCLERTVATLSGLLHVCKGDVTAAEPFFSKHNDIKQTAAMNNKAVCAVYSERLPEAIIQLEQTVAANPTGLTETTTQNLCSLYDMESEAPAEKKARVFAVAEAYKGPDFVQAVQAVQST